MSDARNINRYLLLNVDASARELLIGSNPDFNPDHQLGYIAAAAAYQRAEDTVVRSSDPTISAEAASAAEFRGTQAGLPLITTESWHFQSIDALGGDNTEPAQKARVAARIAHGCSLAWRLLDGQASNSVQADYLETQAATSLRGAIHKAAQLPLLPTAKQHPLESLASAKYATFEAMRKNGGAFTARDAAIAGIDHAQDLEPSALSTILADANKQALRLAWSRLSPNAFLPIVRHKRMQIAKQLLALHIVTGGPVEQ